MPDGANLRVMSLPELLAGTVGDESVVADVALGGDDRLAVTPTRTLVYRGDGLLSDESVVEHPHDVERIATSMGRRKAKLTLGYGLDGDETISVPAKRIDDVLHPVLAGVLSARSVTDPGESVVRTFRFSELTLVVTSDRLVKHVGSAVWDEEFEEFAYEDITDLDFEEGTVATAVVLTHGGRSERFKAPNESARAVRETLVDAVCAYYDVDSLEEFRVSVADEAEAGAAADSDASTTDFGEGPDPLSASPVADAEAEAAGTETRGTEDAPEMVTATDADPSAASGDDPGRNDGPTSASGPSNIGPLVEDAPDDQGSGADPLAADHPADDPDSPAETNPLADDPLSADSAPPADPDSVARPEAGGPAEPDGPIDPSATPTNSTGADAFDGSPFESAGVEGADLATEVADLRRTVEQQSERLDRQSALIEQLIEELRRGR